MKGEYLAFQLGVYALENLNNVKVQFSDLKNENSALISSRNLNSINFGEVHPFLVFAERVDRVLL